LSKINLIIPSAGKARRLRPLTNFYPKNLLKVGNKTILEIQIEEIPQNRINKIIFIVGFMKERIINKVNSLNIDVPVSFYYNENYQHTNCAYSLMTARKEMEDGFMLLNSDLLFRKTNFERVLDMGKRNVIAARELKEFRTDLQKINVKDGKITEWSDSIKNANGEIMGPLKICSDDIGKVINYYDSLSDDQKEKMHCFSLFSNCIKAIDYYALFINDNEWREIDTHEDLENTINFSN